MAVEPLTWEMMQGMCVIGVDPGKTGGIAWVDGEGLKAVKMPPEEKDACRYIHRLGEALKAVRTFCYFEKPFISPRQASQDKYLSRHGAMIGSLYCVGYQDTAANVGTWTPVIYEVTPDEWREAFPELEPDTKLASRKAPRSERASVKAERRKELKSKARGLVTKLYPSFAKLMEKKGNDGIADAILICTYAGHQVLKMKADGTLSY